VRKPVSIFHLLIFSTLIKGKTLSFQGVKMAAQRKRFIAFPNSDIIPWEWKKNLVVKETKMKVWKTD